MKAVIFYSYYETPETLYNLNFYSKFAITNNNNYLFIITVNGYKCSVQLPNYNNCVILYRENEGFDYGAHYHALNYLLSTYECDINQLPFDYFIFMNSGVTGPFLPAYYPKDLHWSNIFTSKLNDRVKLVGSSIVCLPVWDDGGYGPKVEGFCFATDKIGLGILIKNGSIFKNHLTKHSAVVNGEYGMSREIINNGYTIDCLLYKYQDIDWTDKKNWNLNNNKHPSRRHTYDGIDIHPFEVVFHKCFWAHKPSSYVGFEYFEKYTKWKLTNVS